MFELVGREDWFGHARLSIIDVDSEGNQQMCSDDGRCTLIFNREIYNYIELRKQLRAPGAVFNTRSDMEALP